MSDRNDCEWSEKRAVLEQGEKVSRVSQWVATPSMFASGAMSLKVGYNREDAQLLYAEPLTCPQTSLDRRRRPGAFHHPASH